MNVALGEAKAFAFGLLSGDDSGLSSETISLFRTAGIAHLTAASGANLALVGSVAIPFRQRQRRLGEVLTIALYLGYWVFTGGSGSLWRATFWAFFALAARFLGRAMPAAYGLVFVVLATLMTGNNYSRTVGFWLSVGASGGLIISRKIISGENNTLLLPQWQKILFSFLNILFIGTVVCASVAPIIWILFGDFSMVGAFSTPVTSVFVLPLQLTGLLVFGFERFLKTFVPLAELCLLWQFQIFVDITRHFTTISADRFFVLCSAAWFIGCIVFTFRVVRQTLRQKMHIRWLQKLMT